MPDLPPYERAALHALCERRAIRTLALFGSRRDGRAAPGSDIDLLVTFEAAARPTLLDLAQIEHELSGLFGGLAVDLRTPAELSRYFRDEVIRSAAPIYP